MFDLLQPWAIGLAAVLDTALLVVLLERRNRPFARVPIVAMLLGAWLFHVSAFLSLVAPPLPGPWGDFLISAYVLVMAAGLLLKPSSLLHASARLWRNGMDVNPPANPWYILAYLPLAGLIPLARTIDPSAGPNLFDPLRAWAMPYAVGSSIVNILAAFTLIRVRQRIGLPGAGRFFVLLAILLLVQSGLNLFVIGFARHAWPEWQREMLFACGVPSVAIAAIFAYFLFRYNFLQLVMERAIVYGALLAAIAVFHQFAFQEATVALPRSHRLSLVLLEAAVIACLIALYRPFRLRVAEAIRSLTGVRTGGVRERLRDLSMRLSLQSNEPISDILAWFAAELRSSLDVDFVAGWLFRSTGAVRARFGDAARLTDDHARALARQMASDQVSVSVPPYPIGQAGMEACHAAGISLAVRKTHKAVEGLLIVGRHARGRDLSDEEANAVVLLVEQLAVALENSLLLADRLAAERRAGHLEKLSALGLMASAIAHEVKNPLSAIKTIAAVLAEELGPDSPHTDDVHMIRGEIDRMIVTTQQLLEFSRPAAEIRGGGPVQVECVLSSTAQILRRLACQSDIRIETRFGDDLPPVRSDEAALREIFFNLISNSLDAAGEGGCVTLVCTRLNGHVVTEVRDSGPGLSADVRERLFEPFVTTKSSGTGLGLYVVSRRVGELGGEIAYEDGPNGTCFIVRIPAS